MDLPAKHVISLWDEFKKFAFRGNMIDLAIALVVGQAFTKLVESFVKSIVMPTIALVAPGDGIYTQWNVGGVPVGQFVGEFVNFLIVALAVFVFMVKILGFLRKKEEPVAPPPTRSEELLTEIRDLLKKPA